MYKPNKTYLICLFVYCVLVKVLPFALLHFGLDIRTDEIYPWSFTPLFAFGIFGLAMFRNIGMAFVLPLLATLLGDLLIGALTAAKFGGVEGFTYLVYPSQLLQYLALLVCISCGAWIRVSRNWLTIGAAAVIGPTLFYVLSNLAVWKYDLQIGYTRDLAGLTQCYIAGFPFYIRQFVSTGLFASILFSPVGMRNLLTAPKGVTAEADQNAAASQVITR